MHTGILIIRYGKGRCLITGQETEGVEVEFQDGSIRGFVSMKQFTKLLVARAESGGPQREVSHAPRESSGS